MNKKSNWSQIKSQLQESDPKEIIKIVGELYKLSKDNKGFLEARFTNSKSILTDAIEIIKDSIDPPSFNLEIDFVTARKAISNYKKARPKDSKGILELMLCYVETANQVTLSYGDMWEQFYINIETMYEKTCKVVVDLKKTDMNVSSYSERLKTLMESTYKIGWGYHDSLNDIYHEYFEPK